jgi:hypothetical protein
MSFMDQLREHNLCTYFVLPLLRLNKFSFISSNFVNSYLSKDGRCIIVEVYDALLPSREVFTHPGYQGTAMKDNMYFLVFTTPQVRHRDVSAFMKGKYSKMSNSSKELIYELSGLDYKKPIEGKSLKTTDGRLLALTRHEELRKAYERELDLEDGLSPDDELLDPPDERTFIDLKDLQLIDKPRP